MHGHQQFIRFEGGGVVVDKKVAYAQTPRAATGADFDFRVQRQEAGGRVGGGVGVAEVAAQRALVAHLWIGQVRGHVGKHRIVAHHVRRSGEFGMARQRTDAQPGARIEAHALQGRDVRQ